MSTDATNYSFSGHIIVNHWSNGNKGWSGGAPTEDAVITIMDVNMYLNNSNARSAMETPFRDRFLSTLIAGLLFEVIKCATKYFLNWDLHRVWFV